MLEAGTLIPEATQFALVTSVVAVLLISADYIASDLMDREFPNLLDKAEQQGTRILWILAGSCHLGDMDRLTRYQRVCPEASPLDKHKKPKQDEIYVELLKSIKKELARSNRYPN